MYERLQEELKARGMSTYALSKKTGIASNHLYRALGGKTTLFPGWKARIAEALSMDEADLFADGTPTQKDMIASRIKTLKEELARLEKELADD